MDISHIEHVGIAVPNLEVAIAVFVITLAIHCFALLSVE